MELLENYLKDTYNPIQQSKVENQMLDINMQNRGENAAGLSITETIDPENEVNHDSMVTTDHQVKVIATKDLSLLDNSLPVFRIPIDKEPEEVQELGHVERVATESLTVCSDIPEIPNITCIPKTLKKESNSSGHSLQSAEEDDRTTETVNVQTANARDPTDESSDVMTPADPKERSSVTTNTHNNELTDDALSDLMSPWSDNTDTCNGETAVNTTSTSVTEDHIKETGGSNGEQWSRGQMLKNSSGGSLEVKGQSAVKYRTITLADLRIYL